MTLADIPVVSFDDFLLGSAARREQFVQTLGRGLERFGFVAVRDHGIDDILLTRAYAIAEQTFALPYTVKRAYETPEDGRQRGYTSFGIEHAKDHATPDLKEFWHVGRTLPDTHALRRSGDVPRNRFPDEIPGFEPTFTALFSALDRFANALLGAIGTYLELGEDFFAAMVADGSSLLRIIHYPPLAPETAEGAVRAAKHEDINLITVLPVSTQPGLELLTRDGTWLEVSPPPGVMVCDTGDMMALLTAGRLPSTTHRVVNPTGEAASLPRFSMPFFCHPHPDCVLRPIDGSATSITAREFLFSRLREIGVA